MHAIVLVGVPGSTCSERESRFRKGCVIVGSSELEVGPVLVLFASEKEGRLVVWSIFTI